MARTLSRKDPTTALSLAPNNGRIQGQVALGLISDTAATKEDRERATKLARAALLHEPTAETAVAVLGYDAVAHGREDVARRRFALAEWLSRRDLYTQLWAIEDAVGRGDYRSALRHYDTAMRTTPQAWDSLFPVLNSAAVDPVIRSALVPIIAKRPVWADDFIAYASRQQTAPLSTAMLFRAVDRAGGHVSTEAHARALSMLIDLQRADDAWAYYTQLHPGADRLRSRDPDFRAASVSPTLFDWVPVADASASTMIAGGLFDFSVPPSVGGPLLRQYELLPPGTYRLSGKASGINQSPKAMPYWVFACRGGPELGRVDVSGEGPYSGQLTIPARCPIQILTLMARPSEAVTGLSGQIERAVLEPAS